MKPERPRPEEVQFFQGYAQELKESFESVLRELIPYPHFVMWRYKLIDGKLKKPPFNPKSFYPAQVDNPNSWGTLDQALNALASGYFHGIGFVFYKRRKQSDPPISDPFTGMDFDHCIEKDGTIAAWAKVLIDELNTYTEYSPSTDLTEGRAKGGVRMIVEGVTEGGKFGDVEMWSDTHYMTITTRHIDTTPKTIEKRQDELARLYHTLVPQSPRTQGNTRGVWLRHFGRRRERDQNQPCQKNQTSRLFKKHSMRSAVTFQDIGTAIRHC